MGSASSERCQLSQSRNDLVRGTVNGRPRASDILQMLSVHFSQSRRHETYPRSSTNNEIQHLSRFRSNKRPRSDHGSTSGKPSIFKAALGSRQSPRGNAIREPWPSIDVGTSTLCKDKSMAIVLAMDMYTHVSSSVLCLPGNIHGMFTIKASTISTDLYWLAETACASFLT